MNARNTEQRHTKLLELQKQSDHREFLDQKPMLFHLVKKLLSGEIFEMRRGFLPFQDIGLGVKFTFFCDTKTTLDLILCQFAEMYTPTEKKNFAE